jgi:glycosyltransferase involved in cell wall biosynthesis
VRVKILMVAPTPFIADRGCHVRVLSEVTALQSMGHDVVIATYGLGRDLPGVRTARIFPVPWYRKLSAGPSWHKYYLDLLLLGLTATWNHCWRPELIHAHLHEGAFIGAWARGWRDIPLLLDYQGSLVDETAAHHFTRPGTLHHSWLGRVEDWVERRVDAIITNSQTNAERLRHRHPELENRLHILGDTIDTEKFRPGIGGDGVRSRYGIPVDAPLILYAGVLSEYQGVDLLIEALACLRSRHRFHALIIGYPDQDKYQALAASLGVAEQITFAGRVDFQELPSHLAAADLAVSAKRHGSEGNGKLCAYLAAGLPVVAFDTAVNREIAGDAAVLVAPVSAAALCGGMESLLKPSAEQSTIRERARRRAIDHLSEDAVGETLVAIYAKVLRTL